MCWRWSNCGWGFSLHKKSRHTPPFSKQNPHLVSYFIEQNNARKYMKCEEEAHKFPMWRSLKISHRHMFGFFFAQGLNLVKNIPLYVWMISFHSIPLLFSIFLFKVFWPLMRWHYTCSVHFHSYAEVSFLLLLIGFSVLIWWPVTCHILLLWK